MRWKIFTLALLFALSARAEVRFAEGVKLFQEGQFEQARQIFRADAPHASTPSFFYNYGTAALKAGAAGEAYVALWRASLASPFDADIQNNWQMARAKLSPNAAQARPATWISWWPDAVRWAPWQAWALAGLLFAIPFLWAVRAGADVKDWMLASIAGIFLVAASLTAWQNRYPAAGLLQETKIFSGPGKTYPEISPISAGSLVSLEETRDGWCKIRFLGSRLQESVGWVEESTVLKLDGGA